MSRMAGLERAHLAGPLGRAIPGRIEALGWARRDVASRAVTFTGAGRAAFERFLAGSDRHPA